MVANFNKHFSCGQNGCCFFVPTILLVKSIVSLQNQANQKQALLGSNLSGIGLMADKKVKRKESYC
jgi:hypothetical protein